MWIGMEACDLYIREREREHFAYKRAGISDTYSNKMEICMAMHANTCIVLYVSVFGSSSAWRENVTGF